MACVSAVVVFWSGRFFGLSFFKSVMMRKLLGQMKALNRDTSFVAVADEHDFSIWTVGVTPSQLSDAGLEYLRSVDSLGTLCQ